MRLTARGRFLAALGILVLILAVLAVPAGLWLRSVGLWKASDPHGRVVLVIPKGSGTSEIGDLLADKGVIDSATGFRLAVYLEGDVGDIQAGRYTLPLGLSAKDALAELQKGPHIPEIVSVTFPEGSWLEEFADIYAETTGDPKEDFMEAATSGRIRSRWQPDDAETLEGLLFPATYEVATKNDATDMVKRLVDEFDERFAEAGAASADRLGITPYEAVIVASMIEAEAFVDSERPKIASVIYNRLEEGTPLGIDATIIYGLGERGRDLTDEDLATDSPYNTRENVGLPPTPIGSPGEASLEAALNPADTDLFYYVLADCDGHHAFSETYEEFLANVERYRELDC